MIDRVMRQQRRGFWLVGARFQSARIDCGRLLRDDAAGRAVDVGQTLADQTTRKCGHRDTLRPGLVVEPRDEIVVEPGRVVAWVRHGGLLRLRFSSWSRP